MERVYFKDREDSNIDLIILIRNVWMKKTYILLCSIIFCLIFMLISKYLLKPKFKSTTKMYIVNQENNDRGITTQDLQLGSLLIQDYKEIMLSNSVLEPISKEFNISISQLRSMISINSPRDNRIMTITVIDTDSKRSADLANNIRIKSIESIKNITKVNDITTIDEARIPLKNFYPSIKNNSIIGLILGFSVSFIFVVSKELLDDRVKYPEDVEDILKTSLLGILPKNTKRK